MDRNLDPIDPKGVPDLVLLEEINEDTVYSNLVHRYNKDQIYTYIGDVIIVVNPYRDLKNITPAIIEQYRGKFKYECNPHTFAVANDAYAHLLRSSQNQCIIISGESGAGKTESSRHIMTYIAAVSKSPTSDADKIKKMLLECNPLLEAFGNARTLRNDNSSRFGKYMEIHFKHSGEPVGGRIAVYMLEKGRVTHVSEGERNFHVFYQMLAGMPEAELDALQLNRQANTYTLLNRSSVTEIKGVNDSNGYEETTFAMRFLGFTDQEVKEIFSILAAILHLGNIRFANNVVEANGCEATAIENPKLLELIGRLLGVDSTLLQRSLLFPSVSAGVGRGKSIIILKNNKVQATSARDGLCKALYERLFLWISQKINMTLACDKQDQMLSIGILDIYGFEIFENNSFEQFCINLCNEKLQQVFIELTLKSEQDEYVKEGIEWTPIKYFNNKIICDMIESVQPPGILTLIDDTLSLATRGDAQADSKLMDKLNNTFRTHEHYASYLSSRDRSIPDNHFRIKHYAGNVTYCINGFVDKSKDSLGVDIIQTMQTSKLAQVHSLFKDDCPDSNKRTPTAGKQFKDALNLLVARLLKCNPHYVRCIKPNEEKLAKNVNELRFRHQIQYLGLVENVRVRRAGFAYRRDFNVFLNRYKMITKQTWPTFPGLPKDASKVIVESLGVPPEGYRLGKTKIFIKEPKVIFELEARREQELPWVVTKMQKTIRGFVDRKKFNRKLALQKIIRLFRWAQSKKYMIDIVKKFGHADVNNKFLLADPWPQVPPILQESIVLLQKVQKRAWAWSLISSIPKKDHPALRQKLLAFDIFYKQKPWSPDHPWQAVYLEQPSNPHLASYKKAMEVHFTRHGDARVNFCEMMNKINRDHKVDFRAIVVTDMNIYKHKPKSFKVKKPIPISEITDVVVSPGVDCWVVIHTTGKQQDLLLELPAGGPEKVSEFVTVLYEVFQNNTKNKLEIKFATNTTFKGEAKKSVPLQFEMNGAGGSAPGKVTKGKGSLTIASGAKS